MVRFHIVYLNVFSICVHVPHVLSIVQAKAPSSSVIVVGTHIDTVPRAEKDEKIRGWMEMINTYKKNRAHSHFYPRIMGVCFVGIPQKGKQFGVHGPDGLADCIFDVAMKMDVPKGIIAIHPKQSVIIRRNGYRGLNCRVGNRKYRLLLWN